MSVHHSSKHITTVAVGTPPAGYLYYDEAFDACVKVHFHGFADLSTVKGVDVQSPRFTCFGHNWNLELFPGGDEDSNEGMIAVYLCHRSNGTMHLDFGFSVQDSDGDEVVNMMNSYWFSPEAEHEGYGEDNFVERSRLIHLAMIEGTLVIEVRMKLVEATGGHVPQFIPENPLCKNILKKFMDDESADVLFEVGSESEQKGRAGCKKAKTSPTPFRAHY
ncbi:hypothetical protein ACHAXR_005799, partial [Thalassiosira sp. AJA248-18]